MVQTFLRSTISRLLIIGIVTLYLSPSSALSQSRKNTPHKYKTKYVIVCVIDGPRYSETWGDSSHRYIKHMANDMAKEGVVFTNFQNDGITLTNSGHTAICTGFRQELENRKGSQLPSYPSFFQYYLQQRPVDSSKSWVITTKDKLEILSNCDLPGWKNHYKPQTNCGIAGIGTGYRNDSTTFRIVMEKLKKNDIHLLLVNFKEPDHSGHAGKWDDYLKGIITTDSLVWEIWKTVQSNPYYKDKTSFFVTNDHGRHADGWMDGFISHGDSCLSCRHINLFASGPDFKQNTISSHLWTQVDLTATIADLLEIEMPHGQGQVIEDCYIKK